MIRRVFQSFPLLALAVVACRSNTEAPKTSVQLSVVAAKVEDGEPKETGPLDGRKLAAGEVAVVHYTLASPAYAYLLVAGNGQIAAVPLEPAPMPAGEHDVEANEKLAVIDPRSAGGTMKVGVIASATKVDPSTFSQLKSADDRAALKGVCPDCNAAVATITAESETPAK